MGSREVCQVQIKGDGIVIVILHVDIILFMGNNMELNNWKLSYTDP